MDNINLYHTLTENSKFFGRMLQLFQNDVITVAEFREYLGLPHIEPKRETSPWLLHETAGLLQEYFRKRELNDQDQNAYDKLNEQLDALSKRIDGY